MKTHAFPGRFLIAASAPRFCPVCGGERVVRLVRVDRVRGAGRVRCVHCVDRIPVIHLPFRTDHPRGGDVA